MTTRTRTARTLIVAALAALTALNLTMAAHSAPGRPLISVIRPIRNIPPLWSAWIAWYEDGEYSGIKYRKRSSGYLTPQATVQFWAHYHLPPVEIVADVKVKRPNGQIVWVTVHVPYLDWPSDTSPVLTVGPGTVQDVDITYFELE